MTIADRLAAVFGYTKQSAPSSLAIPYDNVGTNRLQVFGRNYSADQLAEGARKNAAVMQCVSKLVLSYADAPMILRRTDDDSPVGDHPLQALVDRPNPEQSAEEAAIQAAIYIAFGGAAYGIIGRNALGQPVEIRYHPTTTVRAVPATDGRLISHYTFDNGRGDRRRIDAADVIALRWPTMNPAQPWEPVSPLQQIPAELATDDELTRYLSALLQNDAVVRTLITDPKGSIVTEAQRSRVVGKFEADQSGARRGRVTVLAGGLQVNRVGLDLAELAFDSLRRVPETRIAGAFLMSPVLAGLAAGLDNMTYDNFNGARLFFYEDVIVKMWRLTAASWSRALIPADRGSRPALYFWHDTRDVLALRLNEDKSTDRLAKLYAAGVIDRAEARGTLGFEVRPDDRERFVGDAGGGSGSGAKSISARTSSPSPSDRFPIARIKAANVVDLAAFYKGFNERAAKHAGHISDRVGGTLATLGSFVIAELQRRTSRKDLTVGELFADGPLFAVAEWKQLIELSAGPTVENVLIDQLVAASLDLGEDWRAISSPFDESVAKSLAESVAKITEPIDTVARGVRDQLTAILTRDPLASSADLTRALQSRFEYYETAGAARIGRTTATFATGTAQRTVYDSLDVRSTWLDEQLTGRNHRHRHLRGAEPDPETGLFLNSLTGSTGRHPGGMSSARDSVNCMCILRPRLRKP